MALKKRRPMPDGMMWLILGAVLLVHGLGHGGAIGALWWVNARPGTETGGWAGQPVGN
jgi:hypothetical protein